MTAPVVLTWNVAGRVRDTLKRQIEALAAQRFDLLCLQEITPTTKAEWIAALAGRGLHVAVSEWVAPPMGSRRLAVLIAGRDPLELVAVPGLPWPERHLAVRTRLGDTAVEVHTLHAPLSQKAERVKVETLEAVFAAVAVPDGMPRVVAGDLNTPRYESREGEITTFADVLGTTQARLRRAPRSRRARPHRGIAGTRLARRVSSPARLSAARSLADDGQPGLRLPPRPHSSSPPAWSRSPATTCTAGERRVSAITRPCGRR
jgi:endonuclease/exonuclease/phosphatase family metal-dependent hydrolase